MKVRHEGKTYNAKVDRKTGKLFFMKGKKKVWAGWGEGNMLRGFKVVK